MGSAIGSTGTSLIAAVLLADFVSGVVHWAEDAYARVKPQRKLALINKIAEENDLHHERPRAFLAKGWWASSWRSPVVFGLGLGLAQPCGAALCGVVGQRQSNSQMDTSESQ
jgi:Lipid desaturase domain